MYANYVHAIDIFEGGVGVRTLKTAGLFATYPVCALSLVQDRTTALITTAAGLYDFRVLFLLRVPGHDGASDHNLRYDGQEEHASSYRPPPLIPIPSCTRHRSRSWNGNWYDLPLSLPVTADLNLSARAGYAINPARDLGPRLLTSMVGYGKVVYTFKQCVNSKGFKATSMA